MDLQDVIRFSAIVAKVQTLSDGGLRVTLDLPESAIESASRIMKARLAGALLEVAAVPIDVSIKPKPVTEDGRPKEHRRIRKSTLYARDAEEVTPPA